MREDFPFFQRNHKITYMDSAATSQMLYTVIDDQTEFMLKRKSNAHRSGHSMGSWVDNKYNESKELIGKWLGITDPQRKVVFNSGATQGLNDAAALIGRHLPGGTIFMGIDFHHSMYLPFKKLCNDNPWWTIKLIGLDSFGCLDVEQLAKEVKATEGAKVIAVTAISNVLGKVNDLEKIKIIALESAAISVVDASQIISKRVVNFSGFDFVAFSWHKVYGPMGLGCLLIDTIWLNFDPVRPGGGSVTGVNIDSIGWLDTAQKFEAGTQNLQAIVTIPNLVNWLIAHEDELVAHDISISSYVAAQVSDVDFKTASIPDSGLISLLPVNSTAEDYAMMLDATGVMARAGKLCAQPLIDHITANKSLLRLSWAAYTTRQDIDRAFDRIVLINDRLRTTAQ